MASGRPSLAWFRRDLRLADNPTVAAAARGPTAFLYILDEGPAARPMGAASRWWLEKSLRALDADLRRRGGRLILRRGDPARIVPEMARTVGAGQVSWNRDYERDLLIRDDALAADLRAAGVEAAPGNATLLADPASLRTGAGQGYKVFTPFWRALRARLDLTARQAAPERLASLELVGEPAAAETLDRWGLHPAKPDWSGGFSDWTPGEAGAAARLARFVETGLAGYPEGRERPDLEGSSRLSPHLHFGEVGPARALAAARAAHERGAAGVGERDVESFERELAWREFCQHLLFDHPDMDRRPLRPGFAAFAWRDDPRGLEAWRRGLTGYPIVDAAMRQLWATGWMHNRLRMVAASFLVKHLLIDWREGERWFWDTLVDADRGNNAGNWQWVAGCGADAAPYFRIFNPVLQGRRHDPRGAFVRRWVPELAGLGDEIIHEPWSGEASTLAAAGVRLGETYPAPIVDHAEARARALAAFRALAPAGDFNGGG